MLASSTSSFATRLANGASANPSTSIESMWRGMSLTPGLEVCYSAASDELSLRRFHSRLVALLLADSIVLHPMACWQESRWDSELARFSSQLC